MKTLSPLLTPTVVVTMSCMAWIGGIVLLAVHLLGLSTTAAWTLSGLLALLAVSVISLFIHEFKQAIDLPDFVDCDEFEGFDVVRTSLPTNRHAEVRLPQFCKTVEGR